MRTIAKALIGLALGSLIACEEAPDPEPAAPSVTPAAGRLVNLLPSATLAAVEIFDLAGRWEELRSVKQLARLQDHLLEKLDLEAGDVGKLAGGSLVLALVADEASLQVVPLAVLNPPSRSLAVRRLAQSHQLVTLEERGAVWVGRPGQARRLERVAAGDGTSLGQDVDISELTERLPEGGLARGVINPRALGRHFRRWAEYEAGRLAGTLAALLGLELQAVEIAGFRRELAGGAIVTDAWLGLDGSVVPPAVARAMERHREPAVLPPAMPHEVWLAWSFRTEPQARLGWLRSLAKRHASSPLRNLDFWIEQFEANSGRDVEADILGALGERGLVLLTNGEDGAPSDLVGIIGVRESQRLEASLLDLRGWVAEEIRGRTLELARPINRDAADRHGTFHGLELRSPLGRRAGLLFRLAEDHLIFATSHRGLELGVELASSAGSWRTPDWARGDVSADEIAVIQMDALSRIAVASSLGRSAWPDALGEFLAGAGPVRIRVEYDEGGFRFNGRLQLDGAAPAGAASFAPVQNSRGPR